MAWISAYAVRDIGIDASKKAINTWLLFVRPDIMSTLHIFYTIAASIAALLKIMPFNATKISIKEQIYINLSRPKERQGDYLGDLHTPVPVVSGEMSLMQGRLLLPVSRQHLRSLSSVEMALVMNRLCALMKQCQ